MEKFTDTKYTNTIDSLVSATKSKINNPYYIFSDKKPTKVTYYSQNIEKSTLDEASGLYEAHLGGQSPFKYNKISDFIVYGIEKIATDYDLNDNNGIEANDITGEAYILPNTITPRPGDFFSIAHISESILFKVNSVTADTLDSGANFYRVEYALEKTDSTGQIEDQVEKNFNFIATNIGTDFKAIVQDCDYKIIENLEVLIERLITYFENIFFDARLQTFVYNHDGWNMYDPFLIEFLIRNKVLDYADKFIYVAHATTTNKTFGMDYSRTFFNALENCSVEDISMNMTATADLINDPNSLFVTKMDYYYAVRYFDKTPYKTRFNSIDPDVMEHIKNNKMYEKGNNKEIYNLWIAYFNSDDDFIKGDIISLIKNADYMDNLEHFYMLIISIFIIEQFIQRLLKK